jgi:hypothetical protein
MAHEYYLAIAREPRQHTPELTERNVTGIEGVPVGPFVEATHVDQAGAGLLAMSCLDWLDRRPGKQWRQRETEYSARLSVPVHRLIPAWYARGEP